MRYENNGKRRVGRKEMMNGNGGEGKEEGGRKGGRSSIRMTLAKTLSSSREGA